MNYTKDKRRDLAMLSRLVNFPALVYIYFMFAGFFLPGRLHNIRAITMGQRFCDQVPTSCFQHYLSFLFCTLNLLLLLSGGIKKAKHRCIEANILITILKQYILETESLYMNS